MIDQKKIGIRIQDCRKQQHMTIEHLAELAEISPEFLRSIESGQKGMSLSTLANIAIGLQTSTDYLIFGSSSEEKYDVMIQVLEPYSPEHIHEIARLVKQILNLNMES